MVTGYFKTLSQHFPEKTDGNHEKSLSIQPVCGPRFELWTYKM
jgi:hypothetical protein